MEDRKFIEGFDNRYSIGIDGVVLSHYRYLNNGKKRYITKEVSKSKVNNNYPTVKVKLYGQSRSVTKLMEIYFDFIPPDKHHRYVVLYQDGNPYNTALSNMQYKILISSRFGHYPQPFYNDNNEITHKICACCGDKMDISKFPTRKISSSSIIKTYFNLSRECFNRDKYPDIIIVTDELILKREEHKINYDKNYRKKYVANLAHGYLSGLAKKKGIHYGCLDQAGKELFKLNTQISREIRTNN